MSNQSLPIISYDSIIKLRKMSPDIVKDINNCVFFNVTHL